MVCETLGHSSFPTRKREPDRSATRGRHLRKPAAPQRFHSYWVSVHVRQIIPLRRGISKGISLRMRTTLQRWGNSQGIRIPKAIVESLGMGIGSELLVELSEDRSRITVTPAADSRPVRGRHRIEDLVASSAPDALVGEYDWGEPQGREVW